MSLAARLLLLVLLVALACASPASYPGLVAAQRNAAAPSSRISLPTPTLYPSNDNPGTPVPPICSWVPGVREFTDAYATYYNTNVIVDPDLELTVSGTYPAARYVSFQIDTWPNGIYLAGLHDDQFPPDRGSSNPFISGRGRGGGQYTLHVFFQRPPRHPHPGDIYVDLPAGTIAIMVYRLYLPDRAAGPDGGVPLPEVTARQISTGQMLNCPTPRKYPAIPTATPGAGTSVPRGRGFFRFGGSQGSGFGNVDSATLGAFIWPPNDVTSYVYVIRFTAPTTPHTFYGGRLNRSAQIRYWALCVVDVSGQTQGCLVDEMVRTDAYGRVTIVLGATAAQPRNATLSNNVTWVDLGGFNYPFTLVMRQVLPAPSFHYSGYAVPPGDDIAGYMGPYGPVLTTCATADFEANRC